MSSKFAAVCCLVAMVLPAIQCAFAHESNGTNTFTFTLEVISQHQRKLEKRLINYRGRMRTAGSRHDRLVSVRRGLEQRHARCANDRWRVLWQPRFKEAEKRREKLEEVHRQVRQIERTFNSGISQSELQRIKIEANKHKTKVIDYLESMFNYQTILREKMHHGETEVAYAFEEYLNGIENYCLFVTSAVAACEAKQYGEAVIEKATEHLTEILETINTIRNLVKAFHE